MPVLAALGAALAWLGRQGARAIAAVDTVSRIDAIRRICKGLSD